MERKRLNKPWLWYALAVLLVAWDQAVKLWVRANLELGQARPFLPGFIELYRTENTGAAFSVFSRYTWMLTLLSAAVTLALAVCIWKDWFVTGTFSRLCMTLVLAGAAGNLIDRALLHKVTDMFNFTFMRWGVFNVADVCVVAGVIGYALYVLFARFDPSGGQENSHEADPERPQ